MPGTLLLDDWRNSVGDELANHARQAQQAFQVITNPPPVQTPDPQQVLQELQSHAQQAAQQAQTGLVQFAQQRQQQVQDVGQQLHDYAQQVSQPAQQAVAGVTQFAQPQQAQPQQDVTTFLGPRPAQPISAGQADVQGAPSPDTTVDRGGDLRAYARQAAQRAGIDPDIFVAQIQQESGFTPTAKSPAGAIGIAQFMPGTAAGMNVDPTDPYAALDAAARLDAQNLKKYGGDYQKTLAAYNAGGGAVDQYGGVPPYKETQTYVETILNNAKQVVGGAVQRAGAAIPGPIGQGVQQAGKDISQFGDPQLTNSEAYAACGPAAAVRFAERFGRNPTLREAVDLAKQVGWTEASGMAGIGSQQSLLEKLGVPTSIVQGAQWDRFAKEAQSGNPVTISTPGHYFYADGYDPSSGAFHVGRSGTDLRGGKEWMTAADMEGRMGAVQGALFADNPTVPAKSSSPTYDVGGTRPTPRAPIYAGAMQDGVGNEPAPAPFQVIGDTVGPVAKDLKDAAGQALGSAGEAIGGALGSAGQAIGGAISDVGSGVQQTATDLGTSRAADLALRQGRTQQEQTEFSQRQLEDAQRIVDEQRRRDTEPINAGTVASNAWNSIINATPTQGITLDDYLKSQNDKNQWLEQNNPLRDVPLAGDLLTGIAQQLTDPLQVLMFGGTVGLGRTIGAAAGEQAAGVAGRMLTPAATRFVASVADKFTSGAIVGGLQNALFEAEKPGATPESVGQALLVGAGLGGTLDAAAPAVARIGRSIMDRAPELGPILRSRQRGEVTVDAALGGVPGAVERVRGRVAPEPVAEPTTRMYHGTAGEFERPTADKFDSNGLFGPGYYLTDRPEVAGGVVRNVDVVPQPGDVESVWGRVLGPENPANQRGAVVSRGYAQERAAQVLDAGPNVRPVDVPQNLRLLDADARVTPEVMDAVAALPFKRAEGAGFREPAAEAFDQARRGGYTATGDTVWNAANQRLGDGTATNKFFAGLGFDGITYSGGKRIPMNDAAGAPIEHQATVIFADSLPKIRNALSGRQGGQASVPFAANLGGAAVGGYAGNVATPEDATPEERLRNIGLGAAAGAVGTRGAIAAAERAGRALENPEVQAALRTRQRAEGINPFSPPPREPRTLGDVHSNPHTLREAGPGDTPLGDEDLSSHFDRLQQREADVQARLDAVDEQLRNPNAKPERPPWAAGFTNDQLVQIAREHDASAYEPNWWDRAGLETGSGEVRALGESTIQRGAGQREPTLPELRAERNQLAREQQDLQAAAEQLTTAPAGARFAARATREADLPFDTGSEEAARHGPYAVENPSASSGTLAEDIVTRNGTQKRPSGLDGLWSEPGQVVGREGGITSRGIVDAEAAGLEPPSARTEKLMPNLDAMLGDDMPEVRAQIQKAVEDNPELFAAYTQGRISQDSLRDDLARRVGMSTKDWLKTPVGKGFSTPELVALQAAAVDAQNGATNMAREIMARPGGVDSLSPEEVAFGLANLFDTTRLLAVARGGRSTAGRSLNALKIRMDATLARDIRTSNEGIAARRTRDQARRAAVRATQLLNKSRDLEQEAKQAVNGARERNMPKNIIDQIAAAYDELDRYQAMTLHEKADDFNALKKARDEAAAARKAKVREAPEELLSALQAELKAERDNFAKRKDTWETMAFWDTKANENAIAKRNAFRGGLYLEQQRKSANIAAKGAEGEAVRAFQAASRVQTARSERASRLLEAIGGEKPSKDLLRAFTEAVASDDPMVAAKFLKGLQPKQSGWAGVVEMARNANVMRLAGMLSATATHMVNAGGNVVKAALEVPEHALTVGVDWARAGITGGERQAYAAELAPMVRGWFRTGAEGRQLGFGASLPDAVRVLQTGVSPSELADLSKLRPGFQSHLPGRVGEVVDPTIEMPLRALQASDVMFRGGAFGMHAERVATRRAIQEGYTGPQRAGRARSIIANFEDYPELYKEAADSAARMVFQERRSIPGLPRIYETGTGAEAARIGVSQVLPFKMTPANIFAQGLGLTPLGLISAGEAAGSRGAIAARVAAGALPREALERQTLLGEQRVARAVLGTGILGAAMWMGSQTDEQGRSKGMLTAMYDEDEASTYPQGWRAWSMRVENPKDGQITYVPFQNFGHAGVPLALAAILTDAGRRGKNVLNGEEFTRAVTGLGRYALDNTFLQGVSDWVDALHDPGKAGQKAVEGLVGSYGPYSGMGRQVQRALGVAARNPREGALGLIDALEANYPGASANVPEATTPLGEPRTPGQTGIGAFVSPLRYDVERDNPTLKTLREHGIRVPAEPKALSLPGQYSLELTEAERDQLKRLRGAEMTRAIDAMTARPQYQRADQGLQTEMLQQARTFATQRANGVFQDQLGREEILKRRQVKKLPESFYLGETAAD